MRDGIVISERTIDGAYIIDVASEGRLCFVEFRLG
jgi:hypothetical protein